VVRLRYLITVLMLAVSFSVSLTLPTKAQKRAIEPGNEAEKWAGVGILQASGNGFCSAALINPTTVLTAAHCVYSEETRKILPPEAFRFLAGWRDGITAARREVIRVTAHRDYDPNRKYGEKNIAADIALVELDQPIERGAAQAFGRLDKIRIGDNMSVVSFSGVRSDVATIDTGCLAKERYGNRLMLDCVSTSGMSGAPLFVLENGVPKIAALVSGHMSYTGTKRTQMIALAIERPLRQLTLDAQSIRTTSRDALPYWAARAAAASFNQPIASRKVVSVGKKRLPVVGRSTTALGGRKVVRPPKAAE